MNWDAIPRMLQELCDGHPGYSVEVYRLDYPSGGVSWLCKNCYVKSWIDAGRPPAPGRAAPPPATGTPKEPQQ